MPIRRPMKKLPSKAIQKKVRKSITPGKIKVKRTSPKGKGKARVVVSGGRIRVRRKK